MPKLKNALLAVMMFLLATRGHTFTCYYSLVKDSCWTNYDLQVEVVDAKSNQKVLQITIPKGKSWARQEFACEPAQSYAYTASYQPVFWQTEVGKTYKSLRYWTMPYEITNQTSAWNISVCFPRDFAGVPFPPEAKGNCECDFKSLPEIKPK